jgi:hypothetical protein
MTLTVGDLVDYLAGVPRETPVVVEAPMPNAATLFVDHLYVDHGERGNEDEIVIAWEVDDAALITPES